MCTFIWRTSLSHGSLMLGSGFSFILCFIFDSFSCKIFTLTNLFFCNVSSFSPIECVSHHGHWSFHLWKSDLSVWGRHPLEWLSVIPPPPVIRILCNSFPVSGVLFQGIKYGTVTGVLFPDLGYKKTLISALFACSWLSFSWSHHPGEIKSPYRELPCGEAHGQEVKELMSPAISHQGPDACQQLHRGAWNWSIQVLDATVRSTKEAVNFNIQRNLILEPFSSPSTQQFTSGVFAILHCLFFFPSKDNPNVVRCKRIYGHYSLILRFMFAKYFATIC